MMSMCSILSGNRTKPSACFNALAELDPESWTIVDDVASITQALIVDDGDARSRHWNDSARALLTRHYSADADACRKRTQPDHRARAAVPDLSAVAAARCERKPSHGRGRPLDEEFFNENSLAVETLLRAMAKAATGSAAFSPPSATAFSGRRRPSAAAFFRRRRRRRIFSTACRCGEISRRSDFRLAALRGDRPTTIYLCLPVGRMESHYRWLRLVVQMACTVLEQMGTYPRDRPPILFMMEEFATLGHMEIMERAAAYFPGFGVKLWAVLAGHDAACSAITKASWETFLGNAGLVQCFANGDQSTLDYIARRLEQLVAPFELRTAFSRQRFSQLLMIEGEPPAAAIRLEHEDVAAIRAQIVSRAKMTF